MEIKKLLPIGSVVRLKGGVKRLMIHGIKQTDQKTGQEYDYIGVLYPEGNVGEKFQYLFNEEQIESVVFRGYEDASREEFLNTVSQYYETENTESDKL